MEQKGLSSSGRGSPLERSCEMISKSIRPFRSLQKVFFFFFYFKLWQPSCSGEQNGLSNFGKGSQFNLVPYFLIPHDPVLNLTKVLSRTSFWAILKLIGLKMWPLECSQGFSMTWSCDLLFDPTRPSFELDRDFVKDIILSKFEVD